MAELKLEGDDLVLELTHAEKLEAIHGDLRTPLSSVTEVEVLPDAHKAADFIGFKVGTRIFGVIEVGTIHGRNKTIFAAVHHDTPSGVRVTLSGADQSEWVVGCADPESVASAIRSRL